ncbi:unnamed protein product [Discula destructiva]
MADGHARSLSSDRTLVSSSCELGAKDSWTAPFAIHLEDHFVEYSLDPSWDEAYAATGLSAAARTYLINRHGTLDLEPMPSATDSDPYNWRQAKKVGMLVLVGFHACMATIIASAIIPAYSDLAEEFGNTIQDSTYLTAVQIAILGVSPLVWRPLANTYGRRPIFLCSLIVSALGNIACALSRSYELMMFFRAVVAFFISPASAIGSAVVAETFFKKDRGRYIGIWMVMVTLGVPIGPLIFGFVTFRLHYRFIFWILAIINGVQLILYFFFGPETLFLRMEMNPQGYTSDRASGFVAKYLHFRRINPRRLTLDDYLEPLRMITHPRAMLPALAYSIVFLVGSILTMVEIPVLSENKFNLNAEQIGLQFIGVVLGSLIGEQVVGGALSDLWMRRQRNKLSYQPEPESRLWPSYVGYALTIAGGAIFLAIAEKAPAGKWTVVPVVGTAIAAVGNQVVTTVLVTYAVDCAAENAASVGVFVSLIRQTIGFLGPFWFPSMFSSVGLSNSSAIVAVLIIALSVVPTVLLQWKGHQWN